MKSFDVFYRNWKAVNPLAGDGEIARSQAMIDFDKSGGNWNEFIKKRRIEIETARRKAGAVPNLSLQAPGTAYC